MSLTYIASITQFLVALGFITSTEATTISDGVSAIIALLILLVTLYGRWRAGGVNMLGMRK